jgi:hypothetical protein
MNKRTKARGNGGQRVAGGSSESKVTGGHHSGGARRKVRSPEVDIVRRSPEVKRGGEERRRGEG